MMEPEDTGKESREPIDFEGFSTQKDLPVGDFRERPIRSNLVEVTVACPECHGMNRRAKRACDTCDGAGVVKKVVTQDEITGEDPLNCDKWGEVDFGLGPVLIRCTQSGEHDEHGCTVIFEEDEEEPDPNLN